MKILSVIQGSDEWLAVRRGVVTASEADALVTPKYKVRTGDGVESYMYRKLAEKAVGWRPEGFESHATSQGQIAEKIALPWYNFTYNANARQVGFCVSDDGRIGCSPDALIGDDSGLELKLPTHPKHLQYLSKHEVPDDYKVQVQFSLYVTGRPHWDFCSWSKVFDPLVVHVEPDPEAQAAIAEALAGFFAKFDPLYAKLKGAQDEENRLKTEAYEARIRTWENTGIVP